MVQTIGLALAVLSTVFMYFFISDAAFAQHWMYQLAYLTNINVLAAWAILLFAPVFGIVLGGVMVYESFAFLRKETH